MDDLEDLARRQRRERDRTLKPQRASKTERTSYVTERGPLLRLFPEWLPVAFSVLVAIGGIAWNAIDDDEEPRSATKVERVERSGSTGPADWITADDYPPSSIRAGEEGTVAIRWTVDDAGRVRSCEIASTSGFPRLDAAACRAITSRARYAAIAPGTEPRSFTRRVVWRLPD